MATIPTMSTWTAGEYPTAAKMNSNIRDAGNFFKATPVVSGSRSAATTLASSTFTDIVMDTPVVDNDSMYGTTVFTVVTPGIYLITARCGFTANATGNRLLRIMKGSTAVARAVTAGTATNATVVHMSYTGALVAGDTLKLQAWQSSGGNLDTMTGQEERPILTAIWLAS